MSFLRDRHRLYTEVMLAGKATGVIGGLMLVAACGGGMPPPSSSDLPEHPTQTPVERTSTAQAAVAPQPSSADTGAVQEEPVPADSGGRDEFKAKPKRDRRGKRRYEVLGGAEQTSAGRQARLAARTGQSRRDSRPRPIRAAGVI